MMGSVSYTELIDRARRAQEGGDHFEAAKLFHDASMIARQQGMMNECAYALRHCALANIEIGHFDKALGCGTEALGIYEDNGGAKSPNAANTLRLIALAREGEGEVDTASRQWRQARIIYQQHDIADGIAECDSHLEVSD